MQAGGPFRFPFELAPECATEGPRPSLARFVE